MDFLILKKTGELGDASDWQPVSIVLEAESAEEAVTQGYTGDGRYRALEWPAAEDCEFDLAPSGPPAATPVTPPDEEEEG
jgi:hypothetical protein